MSRRVLIGGLAAIAIYVVAASFTARHMPVRPLFDGLAPPPTYQWVSPPPDLRANNSPPSSASQRLDLKHAGTDEVSVATSDGQATLILPQGAFIPVSAQDKDVKVDITPLNAAKYGPPPSRLAYAGNAYAMSAIYEPSNKPADLALDATILMSYATTAKTIARRENSSWTMISTTDVPASLQVFARTKQLGVFVPAGAAVANSLRWWTLGIASGVAGLLGLGFGLRERRRLHRGG